MRRWQVILISPQESGNIGAAARVVKNFGAAGLRIVAPRCEVNCPESRRFSAGAAELLREARLYETLTEALADRELTIGLTGLGGKHHRLDCTGLLPAALLAGKDHLTRCALVFGREESGMTGGELEQCDFLWTLPTSAQFSSLNLAQAIGITLAAVSEVERQFGGGGAGKSPARRSLNPLAAGDEHPATHEQMGLLLDHFEKLMTRVGWSGGKRMRGSLATLRNLLARASATQREVNLLHGLCNQSLRAIEHPEEGSASPPVADGEDGA